MKLFVGIAVGAVCALTHVSAAPVTWVDWTSGTAGANSTAGGSLTVNGTTVNVSYSGQIAFVQTNGGVNYWNPSVPYMSSLVNNAPPTSDIIANSTASVKTLTFSQPVDNLFFAVVSLNGNGYRFSQDFDIVSTGCGYFGCGGLTKVASGGTYDLNSTGGEPHGVIRFTGAVSTITWTSLTNEYWNGFTLGTYGLAQQEPVPGQDPGPTPVPEPSSVALAETALLGMTGAYRLKRRSRS
ncbi:MAG: PEP-CTERM sorting domain-containing protein [Bryobacteraceae bacterium]